MRQVLHPFPHWELSVSTNDAEGTTLASLDIVSPEKAPPMPGVVVAAYCVEPGKATQAALPEVEIRLEFPLCGVARVMPPQDFAACSIIGMRYDTSWTTQAVGYEPFAVFAGADGECKGLIGLSRLEHSSWIRAHVFGGPPESVASGVKGIGGVQIRRNAAELGHFKGQVPAVFEDEIYMDMAGGDIYSAVRRYFTWLREHHYPQSPTVPDGSDEVLWHSWYAHQAAINQEMIRERARELDIRRVQIDAYWDVPPTSESVWGGNVADPERFPDFPGLIRDLHAAGQRVALHTSPFVVDPFLFAAQKPLEPFLLTRDGTPLKGEYNSYLLCPRCPQTRDHILGSVRRLVGDYGIDEIWYDFVDYFEGLYGECDNPRHEHVAGAPGERVIAVLREIEQEARRINPSACLWGRRHQCNPITRQWESHLSPHDRYLDYLGNLRECLFLHQLAHRQQVEFVCTNWPVAGEDPAVVARHMICGIFAGIPALSVDLARQSPEALDAIRAYVSLYRRNKAWLNPAPRRLVCPEDAIRCVALDGPHACWILCTGTAPGILIVPEHVCEIRIFSSSFGEVASLLPLRGTWRAACHDYLLRKVDDVPLETVKDGLFLRATGTPLFSVRMERLDG